MPPQDVELLDRALAIAARTARHCIPELADRVLYVVQPAPGTLLTREMLGHALGFYAANLDLALQPMLEAAGQWRGPGVAIAVDAWGLFAIATDDDDGLRSVVGTALHECCHWLDRPEPVEAPPGEPGEHYSRLTSALAEWDAREAAPAKFAPSFLSHGESFIRLCCHAWWRASHGGGCILGPHHLAFGAAYRLTANLHSPAEYCESLRSELAALKNLPLREVAAREQPPEFTAIWDRDLEKLFPAANAVA